MTDNIVQESAELSRLSEWIDDAISDDRIKIDSLLISLSSRLSLLGISQQTILFGVKNDSVQCLYDSNERSIGTTQPASPIDFRQFSGNGPHISSLTNNSVAIFCQVLHNDIPIFILQSNHSHQDLDHSLPFLTSVAHKINLAFRFKEERRFDRVQSAFINDYLRSDLATSEAWKAIAASSTEFLPNFSPLATPTTKPLSQILTYEPGDKHLILRATEPGDLTEPYSEQIAIPLRVDETVSGVAIEQNLEFFLTNPAKEYPGRYQAYLYCAQPAKSEVVFPIRIENEVIAVLNIKHPDENVFSGYSIEAIRRATRFLAPFVRAIIEREKEQRRKELGLLYVITGITTRMASLYRHKVSALLLKSRIIVEQLSATHVHDTSTSKELGYLREFINELADRSHVFLTDLPSYIQYRNVGITSAIDQAVEELDAATLERYNNIRIVKSYPDREIYIYASGMLKEHIYNLINNAVLAIKQRMSENRQTAGTINIAVTHVPVPDALREKTISPARVFVKISDDGGGVPAEYYPYIQEFGFTTRGEKGGSGYGLPAAREYIQSINGGDFHIRNEPGVGFSVGFFVQEFDSSFHLSEMP